MALSVVIAVVMVVAFVGGVCADDKEVTLKGTITCAKCDLKQADACHTVVKVEEDGKDVVYYFDKDSSKKYHKKICTSPTKGTVTGSVSEEDGKKVIKVTKLDWAD
jgi:hypothetical protein